MQKEKILEKYKCAECGGEFVIGKDTPKRIYAYVCPYCGTIDTSRIASAVQENSALSNLTIHLPENGQT